MMRNISAVILIPFIILACMVSPSLSQPAMMTENTEINEQQPDSLKVYPEKLRSEERWETIVNFPGRLIFSPFQLTFRGIEEIVEEIDETMIIPRIIEYYLNINHVGYLQNIPLVTVADSCSIIKYLLTPMNHDSMLVRNGD